MHNPRHKQVRICILDLCIYSLCALENCPLVLLFHGCENPGSASLCFKQYRNECEIRKSTNIFLQHADYMNWQFWPRLRNSKLKLSGLSDGEGQAEGEHHCAALGCLGQSWAGESSGLDRGDATGSGSGAKESKAHWWCRDTSHESGCAAQIFVCFHCWERFLKRRGPHEKVSWKKSIFRSNLKKERVGESDFINDI